jgi:outer membrane protein TolC
VPGHWSETLANGVTNSSATNAAWWKTFHDPELDSIIARALNSNLDLRLAGARVREARAARGVVAADYWPSMDASSSFAQERISSNGFPTFPPSIPLQANVYQVGFDATWEVDVFGGTRRAVEAANADISAAEYGRRQTLVSLLGEVARDYMEARGFQRRLAIARENIKSQGEVLALTQERFHAGLSSDLDVQQAATLLATTEAQVPTFVTGFKLSA